MNRLCLPLFPPEVEFALFAGFSDLFHGWAEGALDLHQWLPVGRLKGSLTQTTRDVVRH
ncbi:MAG: hypothetical protein Q6M04_00270 [Thermostichus sp. BF3_bins_97]